MKPVTLHQPEFRVIYRRLLHFSALLIVALLLADYSPPVFAHSGEESEPHDLRLPTLRQDVPVTVQTENEALRTGDADHIPTAEEHFAVDQVVIDSTINEQSVGSPPPEANTRAQSATVMDPGIGGSWSTVLDWPVVGVHAALLPTGQVIAWDSVSDAIADETPVHDRTRAILWDPATSWITRVDVTTGWNVFCAGQAFLPNGSLYVAGGNLNSDSDGLDKTHIFNAQTNQWSVESTMAVKRWYPTVTALPNGEMLITAGRIRIGEDATFPEIRGTDGVLRSLTGASMILPFYPWMQVAPSGKVLVIGPAPATYLLDTSGLGSWQATGNRDGVTRSAGSFAMYDIGKILSAGGSNSRVSAVVTDFTGDTPTHTPTGSMAFGRRHFDLTVLADGTVLATGGNSSGTNHVDLNAGVYAAEVWNPTTGQWTTLNSMQITRQYHSTALLLPDGRVLTAGGGLSNITQAAGYLEKNAEVFSPPYLYKKDGSGQLAPRPVIAAAPSSIVYSAGFNLTMQDGSAIQKIGLVRLGAVTHSVNMDQRYVPLSYTQSGSSLQVAAPANSNIAPPGYYMLFVVDSSGVPSVASMVQLVQASAPPPDDLIFADDFEGGNLAAWSSAVTDGGDLAVQPNAALNGAYGMGIEIDDNNAPVVVDDRPNAEKRYRARFYFDPNAIVMAHNDSHNLFRGYAGASLAVFSLDLRYYNGRYQVRTGALNDSNVWHYDTWFAISDAPHALEIDWQASTASGANNGQLTFWVDGVQRPQLTGIDNDMRQIDRVRLGAIAGIDTGTRGSYYFDAFESRRTSYIGPVANAATSTITLATDPPGLQVTLNGQTVTTPYSIQSPEGQALTLGVVSPQTAGGVTYGWQAWSDNGAATHTINVPVDDTTYTAQFQPAATNDLIFADGFESGTLQAWSIKTVDGGDLASSPQAALDGTFGLLAQIDDNNALAVGDDRPNGETRYRARFYFDPNSITMSQGDAHELFRGFSGTWPAVLDMQLRYYNGIYQVRAGLLNDSTTWRYSVWFELTDTWHALEIDWKAAGAPGANDGALTFWIDGVERARLTGVDNDTRRVDLVRLGAISSLDSGTRGSYSFDAFESRKQNYIGPLSGVTMAELPPTTATDDAELEMWTEEEMVAPQLYFPWLHP